MNQKERTLFVLEAIIKGDKPNQEFLIRKIRQSFGLARPEIMLSPQSKKEYVKIVKAAIKEGRTPPTSVEE